MFWRTILFSALWIYWAMQSAVIACPYCDSEIGSQVRAEIFNEQFWSNAAITLLPLFVLLGIVALITFDLSWLWSKKHSSSRGG